jgi:hypothetical protein
LTGLVDLEKIPIFNKLDNIITEEEIMHGIKSLKCNKSAGPDSITNEMLKCGKQLFVKPLQRFSTPYSRGAVIQNYGLKDMWYHYIRKGLLMIPIISVALL